MATGKRHFVYVLFFTVPPEIIVFDGVITLLLSVVDDCRRQPQFITPAPQEAVPCHDQAKEKAVLFKALNAISRTTRIHGTMTPVNGRNIVSVKPDQESARAGSLLSFTISYPVFRNTLPWLFHQIIPGASLRCIRQKQYDQDG